MLLKNNRARHRATPVRNTTVAGLSNAVSSHAGTVGRSAAVVTAAGGLMLGVGLPANAAADVTVPTYGSADVADTAAPASYEAAPAATTEAASDAATHTVVSGDTVGTIAAQYGKNVQDVLAANGLDAYTIIYPGDQIALTGSGQGTQSGGGQAAEAASVATAATQAAPADTATVSLASNDIKPASTGGNQSIVDIAMQGVGTPYVWGGTSTSGWDCSGFTQWVYSQVGVDLPRTSQTQGSALTPTSNPQPGDLVVQNGGAHIGIYLGGGKMISALNPSQGTLVHDVSAMPVSGYYTM
ncbi:C40 family peptidase [Arthrobacter sp. CAU 1506]|uniref:C40 family peptidase n=1 Tax=Arthrobacter sp. CAU 1506 TaxID=2560052 RepID=UPI001F0E6993|nr:C40 family peptidase [Arthrobacter sp. CAU 1506]